MASSGAAEVTVIVPGLFGRHGYESGDDPFLEAAGRYPAIESLLARADRLAFAGPGFERRLFRLFDLPAPEGAELPVAAVTRLADMGVVDGGWWIRADPVYLEPRRDSLMLRADVGILAAEAEQLCRELNDALSIDGWRLRTPRPDRWYLSSPDDSDIVTVPLYDAAGRNVHPILPHGRDWKVWHTRLNELQILLHTSEVNSRREQAGLLPINSVWFWGGGRLPPAPQADWSTVCSREPLGQALARLNHTPTVATQNATDWMTRTVSGRHLLILDSLLRPLLSSDPAGWSEAVGRLEADWFAPLVGGLGRGAFAGIRVLSDAGPVFEQRRAYRFRFWRTLRPLSDWRKLAA